MNAQWPSKLLGELVENGELSYGIVQPGQHFDSGVPIVRVKDLKAGRVDTSDPLHVEPEVSAKHRRTVLRGGEVLVSIVGSIGEAAVAPHSLAGWNVARAIAVIRPHNVSASWVQLCLRSPITQSMVSSVLNTTVQATLNLSDLKKIPIPLPPKRERDAITDVLGVLDDKIAANDRALKKLYELVTAEFAHALSTGRKDLPLGEAADFHNKRRVPLSSRERQNRLGSVPYYGAAGRIAFVDEALFDEPLVLVGEDGTVIREDGKPVVQYIWGPSWVNNHAHVLTGKAISTEVLWVALSFSNVTHLVTGAVQPKISMKNLKDLRLGLPNETTELEDKVQAFTSSIRGLSDENEALAATRDELLPLLMSGKLRVRDAEKVVSDGL